MQEKYDITGMSCAACSTRVEKAVSSLPGMEQCSVNLLKNSMVVNYDDHTLTSSQIVEAVEKAGYGAVLEAKGGQKTAAGAKVSPVDTARQEYESMRRRVIWSFVFTVPLFLHFHGAHDGVAAAGILPGHGELHDLRHDPVFAGPAGGHHQLKILPQRF